MLSIYSCAFWLSICLLRRNVYLGVLPIFRLACLFCWYWTIWAVCIFWRLIPFWSLCLPVLSLNGKRGHSHIAKEQLLWLSMKIIATVHSLATKIYTSVTCKIILILSRSLQKSYLIAALLFKSNISWSALGSEVCKAPQVQFLWTLESETCELKQVPNQCSRFLV